MKVKVKASKIATSLTNIASPLLWPAPALCQQASGVPVNHPSPRAANIEGPISLLTNLEFFLSLFVLLFGILVLCVETFLLQRANATAAEITKSCVLTLIIIGVIFSITAGFSAATVAPAVGLFGTIAGYLLGRRETREGDGK